MSIFFPIILSNEIFKSSTIVYNFPPNNHEGIALKKRYLTVIWMKDDLWHTYLLRELDPCDVAEVKYESLKKIVPAGIFPVLSLTDSPLETTLKNLPLNTLPFTTPCWRASICLQRAASSTSYQGEIAPFSPKGTLVSFSPFIQSESNIKNYFILLNIESEPINREANVSFCLLRRPENILATSKLVSNNCNIVDLDCLDIEQEDILICYSRNISGVPLFLSYSDDDSTISFEHTHPPASLVIHGNRLESQALLKRNWFKVLP